MQDHYDYPHIHSSLFWCAGLRTEPAEIRLETDVETSLLLRIERSGYGYLSGLVLGRIKPS